MTESSAIGANPRVMVIFLMGYTYGLVMVMVMVMVMVKIESFQNNWLLPNSKVPVSD